MHQEPSGVWIMAYTTIDNPFKYFNTVLYTGNGSTQSITGAGFQPDWVWIKERDDTSNHNLYDSVRGVQKYIYSNENTAEQTGSNSLTAFDSDGFSVGNGSFINQSSQGYASWNWLAGGSGSANTDGGINSTVSVNNTAGFSIVKYGTGTGSATTVGHGMNTAPNFIIIKPLGTIQTGNWMVGGDNIDNTWNNLIELNTNLAKANDTAFNDTAPTSSVFSVGNNNTNRSGENYIAYCFAEKKGYSKFGSYTGNGNADGTFVYTGFKPAWVVIKESSGTSDWSMYDNKREPFNVADSTLEANTSDAEAVVSGRPIDILSNGFKLRGDSSYTNESGATYIYLAFAEAPFVTAGTKAAGTAR
jgi:hypothetical protein